MEVDKGFYLMGTENHPDNPLLVATQVFQERGYGIVYEPAVLDPSEIGVVDEKVDVLLSSPAQKLQLSERFDTMRIIPAFCILTAAFHGDGVMIDRAMALNIVPNDLTSQELLACKSLALRQKRDRRQRRMERVWTVPIGFPQDEVDYPELVEEHNRIREEGARHWLNLRDEASGLMQATGVEPLSTEAMRKIVSGLIDRVETVLTGNPIN